MTKCQNGKSRRHMIKLYMINEKYYKRFGRLNSAKVASIKNNGYENISKNSDNSS